MVPMEVQNANATTASTAFADAAGGWRFAAQEAAAVRQGTVCAEIGELGVIAASGDDAAKFLQGQLTGEVAGVGTNRLVRNGFCTAKGRLLATFLLWRDDASIYLMLPRELLPAVLKRLSMFVLRAKVKLVDDSSAWSTEAVFGKGAAEWIVKSFGAVPAQSGDCIEVDGIRLARLHPGAQLPERFLLLRRKATAPADARRDDLRRVASGVFWWSEIDAAVPTVVAATQEKFVPQMINLELVGGVSFSKGCYPGQEVVARSQYRGKLKRRMQRAHCTAPTSAGADVYAAGESEPVGTVVMAAGEPENGFDMLLECTLEKAEAPLRLQSPDGPAIELRALPYDLVDVTA